MTTDRERNLDPLLAAWVVVVGVPAVFGWGLGLAGWTGAVAPLTVLCLGALAVAWRRALGGALRSQWSEIRHEKLGCVLFLLLLAVGLAYLPAVQDSVSYRIPRIRMWLQDGGLVWIGGTDYRMNVLGRNWEWMGLAILGTTGSERLLVLPSLVSWLVLWRILASWSREFVSSPVVGRALVVVFITAPLFVVQAPSTMNDLYGAVLVAVSVHFLMRAWSGPLRFEAGGGRALLWSGLALALASGVKPNYSVVLPLWLLGALPWMRGAWSAFPWRSLVWAVPMAVVGSSVPTLLLNRAETGHFTGLAPGGENSVKPASPLDGAVWGHPMFWSLSLQPTFNPFIGVINRSVAGIEEKVSRKVPRFHFMGAPFNNGEKATFGVFASLVTLVGCGLGLLRRRRSGPRSAGRVPLWIAGVGVVAMTMNFAAAVPDALGRSSIGFMIPLLPLALWGMGLPEGRSWGLAMRVLALGSVASALLLLALEPNRPMLGPAGSAWVAGRVLGQKSPAAQAALLHYRDRTFAGAELYRKVPEGEKAVGICVEQHTALAEAWRSLPRGTKVVLFRASEWERIKESGIRYLVVAPLKPDRPADAPDPTREFGVFEEVARQSYLQQVSKSAEEWVLLRRRNGE